MRTFAARAPNHLGDGVMALPAMHALAALGDLTIYAPRWGNDLYRQVRAAILPRGDMAPADVAVLFSPSFRAAWQARRCRRRIGTATDGRSLLLTDRIRPQRHMADTYRSLVEPVGGEVTGKPQWGILDEGQPSDVPEGHIAIQPIGATLGSREWRGFPTLAERLDAPVVWYAGPGQERALEHWAPAGAMRRVGLSLPALASSLQRARVWVSIDTGPAHFARACGVPTVCVHVSTSARESGPLGGISVAADVPQHGRLARALRGAPQPVHVPVDDVLLAIERVGGSR